MFGWFKKEQPAPQAPQVLKDKTFGGPLTFAAVNYAVVFDVETTGFSPENDRIITLSALKGDISALAAGKTTNFSSLEIRVNPGIKIPISASRVHGIYNKDVANEPNFEDYCETVISFFENHPIIAHNTAFDVSFLKKSINRAGGNSDKLGLSLCTMEGCAEIMGGKHARSGRVSLVAACKYFGVELNRSEIHVGKEDAMATLKLSAKLCALKLN
jgi:DNA polymerase III subunit epsilon